MDKIIVTGGNTIRGEVTISGAKNAVLPIIAGALLTKDITILHDVPNLSDVWIMKEILEVLGASVTMKRNRIMMPPYFYHVYVYSPILSSSICRSKSDWQSLSTQPWPIGEIV